MRLIGCHSTQETRVQNALDRRGELCLAGHYTLELCEMRADIMRRATRHSADGGDTPGLPQSLLKILQSLG